MHQRDVALCTYDGSMQSRGLRGALVAGAMAVLVLCAPFAHADEVSPAADVEITLTDDGIELIPATSREEAPPTTVTDDGIELIPATSRTEEGPSSEASSSSKAAQTESKNGTPKATSAKTSKAASSVGSAVSLSTSTSVPTTSSPAAPSPEPTASAGAPVQSGGIESSDSGAGAIEVLGVSSEVAAGAAGDSNGSSIATIMWIAAGILLAVGAGALLFRFRNAADR